MNLSNPFPSSVRELFRYVHACWECESNGNGRGGLELHHIFGRVSNSAFNAAPVCHECHSHMGHGKEEHVRLTTKTIKFLIGEGYMMGSNEAAFIHIPCVQDHLLGIKL